jgi:tRNA(Arg) A34 adenosine deaminase TadA
MSLLIGKRKKRFFDLATRVAQNAAQNGYRHGAILVRGNAVLNASHNKNAYTRFGERFRRRDKGDATHHAELGCILGLDRSVTRGADVYVVRVGRSGNLLLSKPCDMCEAALRHVGVRRVYYSLNDGNFEFYRL